MYEHFENELKHALPSSEIYTQARSIAVTRPNHPKEVWIKRPLNMLEYAQAEILRVASLQQFGNDYSPLANRHLLLDWTVLSLRGFEALQKLTRLEALDDLPLPAQPRKVEPALYSGVLEVAGKRLVSLSDGMVEVHDTSPEKLPTIIVPLSVILAGTNFAANYLRPDILSNQKKEQIFQLFQKYRELTHAKPLRDEVRAVGYSFLAELQDVDYYLIRYHTAIHWDRVDIVSWAPGLSIGFNLPGSELQQIMRWAGYIHKQYN